MVNKRMDKSTKEVGDECKKVNRKSACTGMLSNGDIELFAFIIKCLEDSNSTVIASKDLTEGSSVLFGYSFGGVSILPKGHRMMGLEKSLGSNMIDLEHKCKRPSIFVR
mmetsp:Transcript_5682/g.14186  ORF Transcript_5682/g.14186 Transcript_5682/m.14186 type:complete len:109 (+) Transcript_5682:37-363(+)